MASKFSRSFPKNPVPLELDALTQKLHNKFGAGLRVSPVKLKEGMEPTDGIIIEWSGRRPHELFRQLMEEKDKIFGADLWKWQIFGPWGPSQDRGVQILYLDTPTKRLKTPAGFWYY
jgi:hypothetical protein